jgi:60 kDa SS-A/Ro ribonucleoprotein
MTYCSGHSFRHGYAKPDKSDSWEIVPRVRDALHEAFHLSFGNIEPTGKKFYIGLDVSGSMSGGEVGGVYGLTPAVASAAMCMVTARTEKDYVIKGFSNVLKDLGITPNMDFETVMRKTQDLNFGGTDCALPMINALQNKIDVDTFIVYTDSETWAGRTMHPSQALVKYRKAMNPDAKLIVVGMVSNDFTIADPNDDGMLDVVGFDTNTPSIISWFASK